MIVPAAELAKDPLDGAITLHTLRDALKAHAAGGVQLPKVRPCDLDQLGLGFGLPWECLRLVCCSSLAELCLCDL